MVRSVAEHERQAGVRWKRLPNFADDPDVEEAYRLLLEHGRLVLTDRMRYDTARELPAELTEADAAGYLIVFGKSELPPEDVSFSPEMVAYFQRLAQGYRDRFEHVNALYRRAAEDGLRLRDLDVDGGRGTDVSTTRLALDGPLREEDLDPVAGWRQMAEELYRSLRENGDGRLGLGGPTPYGSRLSAIRGDVLSEELSRLADRDGYDITEAPLDDTGRTFFLHER
jgi:SAM-dependent methyltransferase